MRRTLYLKFLMAYLVFAVLGFTAVTTFTTKKTYQYIREKEVDRLYREAKFISSNYAENYYKDSVTLEDVKGHLMAVSTYLNAQIWIVSPAGKVLLDTQNPDESKITEIQGFDITSFGTRYYQVGTFYDTLGQECLTVYAPIIISYKVKGYVLIHMPMAQVIRYSDGFVNIAYMTLAIFFLCAFLLLGIFTYTVYVPIRKITRAAADYSAGNFEKRIHVHSNDEIGYLADSLNYMASELGSLGEDQRKFIANVSHDFRSPLTSIKGYTEAIMDGTIPPELQDKYLNIILVEIERLNKLTQNMLELNKYGNHEVLLDVSNFDINNTIKMTIQSFEGTCTKKRISFSLILTGKQLFVTADMGKIQQVLYNLVDNAIKFSHPDSVITVETTERNDKVFVSVKDTGTGIPKDSISKIWERFYKIDSSRGKDKKGTGLGLSIVKEILQAHNENINVISTEGVGTEFIFTLPVAK